MSKAPGSKPALVLMLFGALGVGALAFYVKSNPKAQRVPDEIRREVAPPPPTEPQSTVEVKPKRHVEEPTREAPTPMQSVFVPKISGENVTLGKDKVSVPEDGDLRVFLGNQILKDLKLDEAHVLDVSVHSGNAVVTFDDAIDSGMGSMQEGQFLKAMQIGYGQFPEIKTLTFYKNGEQLTTLGEHIDLSQPVAVIRPGETEPPSDAKPPEP